MNTLTELKTYCTKMIGENPTLKDEIQDLYQLACDEVEQGGSENHECELAYSDIDYIINNPED